MTEETPGSIAHALVKQIRAGDGRLYDLLPSEATDLIATAIKEAERAALEKAAEVAELMAGPGGGEHASARETSYIVGHEIAAAIRALKSGPTP